MKFKTQFPSHTRAHFKCSKTMYGWWPLYCTTKIDISIITTSSAVSSAPKEVWLCLDYVRNRAKNKGASQVSLGKLLTSLGLICNLKELNYFQCAFYLYSLDLFIEKTVIMYWW